MKIAPVPAYDDNYIWCLYDEESRQAVVVDPGDAGPVREFLAEHGLELIAILITHHHFDHVGGVEQLVAKTGIEVYGPYNDSVSVISTRLGDGDHVHLLGLEFKVLSVPGHTLDHIAYYSESNVDAPWLFCGDTLFAGGCGRVFEGDPDMMYQSLCKLASLPADTQIFCAHEYTLANLTFAQAVEPENKQLLERIETDSVKRSSLVPTVPSMLALEKATNPFLRCDVDSVIESAQGRNGKIHSAPAEVFATIRSWKDNF